MGVTDGELTTVALCWTAERADGAGIALTSHDRVITRDGLCFDPAPGLLPASVGKGRTLEGGDGEIAGALTGAAFTGLDLRTGRWNGARIRLEALDWDDGDGEPVGLLKGQLGEVSSKDGAFSAELRTRSDLLSGAVCPSTSPECRAELGDKHCRLDLAGRSLRSRVVGTGGNSLTLEDSVDDRFLFGRLRYLGGQNCGVGTAILGVEANVVRLRDVPTGMIDAGCPVVLVEGCDKTLATCAARFANAVNFRGEPHIPGNDLLTRYPGS